MNTNIGVAVAVFLVLLALKIRREHRQCLPAEGQLLPRPNESAQLIRGDNPDTESESLLSDIYAAVSGEDLRAIADEGNFDEEESAAFLIKVLELDDELADEGVK